MYENIKEQILELVGEVHEREEKLDAETDQLKSEIQTLIHKVNEAAAKLGREFVDALVEAGCKLPICIGNVVVDESGNIVYHHDGIVGKSAEASISFIQDLKEGELINALRKEMNVAVEEKELKNEELKRYVAHLRKLLDSIKNRREG